MARAKDEHAPDGFELLAPRPDVFGPAGSAFLLVDAEPTTADRSARAHEGDSPPGDGEDDNADAPPSQRRRRRIAAGVGAVAAIGVVAAMVAPNDERTALPPVTTIAGSSTSVPSGAEAAATGYLLDPDVAAAAGFTALGGLSPGEPSDDLTGRLRLWATRGASRTTGTWIAVQRSPEHLGAVQDAVRVAIGDDVGMLVVEPDGITILVVAADDGGSVSLTSRGIALADLRSIADRVRSSPPASEFDIFGSRRFGDFGQLGLVLDRPSIGTGLVPEVLTTGVTANVFYRDEAGRFVSITTSAVDRERDGVLAPYLLRADNTEVRHSDERALVSGVVGMPEHLALGDLHVVSWTEGGSTVRIVSTRSDVDLVALAAGSRPGTEEEWRAVQARARGFVGGRDTQYSAAAAGELPDGSSWTVDVADGPNWANLFVTDPSGRGATAELYLDRSPCASVTTAAATVVACLRRTSTVDEQLHVGGSEPGTPFVDTGTGWSVAVVRTAQLGPLSLVVTTPGANPVTVGRTGGGADAWAMWDAAVLTTTTASEGDGASEGASAGDGEDGTPTADATPVGYVVDGGITGRAAVGAVQTSLDSPIGTLAIWASSQASRTTGTWFAAAVTALPGPSPVATDATRVQFEAAEGETPITAILSSSSDGVSTLQWSVPSGGRVTVVARGLAPVRLLAIAQGVHIGHTPEGEPAVPLLDLAPTSDTGEPLGEIARVGITTMDPGYLALGGGEQWTRYSGETGQQEVLLGVRPATPGDEAIGRLLIGPLGIEDSTVQREVHVAGLDVLSGTVAGQPALRVVRWRDGDRLVTVLSRSPLTGIVDDLRRTRPATNDEWAELLAADQDWITGIDTEGTAIGAGVTDVGTFWSVVLRDRFGEVQLRGGDTVGFVTIEPDADRPFLVLRSTDTTFVVAVLPERGTATGLSVTVGDDEPVILPLTESVSGLSTWVGAAYAFDAAAEGDVSIELI